MSWQEDRDKYWFSLDNRLCAALLKIPNVGKLTSRNIPISLRDSGFDIVPLNANDRIQSAIKLLENNGYVVGKKVC